MGETFAEKFREYLGRRKIPSSSCGVIHSNPDRSKHLETATLAVFGQFIDFVNLRAETYANNSRIPESIAFGSPLEDASRRDITINSMFWNIHSEEIEDFTGLGLSDLEGGIIRTPLPPRETLLDDPLRLLRVVRFATRFQYSIVPELLETMQDSVVHDSLREKVSRERVGIELDKIISDRYGLQGMFLLNQVGVFHTIFGCNEAEFPTCTYKNCEDLSANRIFSLLSSFSKMVYYTPNWDKTQLRLALLACGLIPFAGHKYQYKKVNNNCSNAAGMKEDFIAHAIIRDCLKLSNKDITAVGSVLNHIDRVDSLLFGKEAKRDAITIGRLLKDIGSEYRLALYLATTRRFWLDNRNFEEEVCVREYLYLTTLSNLLLFIDGIGLNDAWDMKPILTVTPIYYNLHNLTFLFCFVLVRDKKFKVY